MELPCVTQWGDNSFLLVPVNSVYKTCSSKVASVSVMSFYLMSRFQEFVVKDNCLNLGNPSEGMCMGLNWVEGGLREHHNSLCWPKPCAWLSRAGWDLGLVFQSQISFVGHAGFTVCSFTAALPSSSRCHLADEIWSQTAQ